MQISKIGSRLIDSSFLCPTCHREFTDEHSFDQHRNLSDHSTGLRIDECKKFKNLLLIPGSLILINTSTNKSIIITAYVLSNKNLYYTWYVICTHGYYFFILSGLGHYEINTVKGVVNFLWKVAFEDLGKM